MECERVRQDLAIAESQLQDYQVRLGQPFMHDAYLTELTGLRDQLKAGLSASAESPADGVAKPTASELAHRIKSLKAANCIEAAPQRARQKQAAAEEPITARIRRRTETRPSTETANESAVAADSATFVPPESTAQPTDDRITFQEYVAMQRRDLDPRLS